MIAQLKRLLQKVLDVTSISLNAKLQSLPESNHWVFNGLLRQVVPNMLQHRFELCRRFWLGCVLLIFVQHCTPNVVVQWVQARRVGNVENCIVMRR